MIFEKPVPPPLTIVASKLWPVINTPFVKLPGLPTQQIELPAQDMTWPVEYGLYLKSRAKSSHRVEWALLLYWVSIMPIRSSSSAWLGASTILVSSRLLVGIKRFTYGLFETLWLRNFFIFHNFDQLTRFICSSSHLVVKASTDTFATLARNWPTVLQWYGTTLSTFILNNQDQLG